MDVPQSYYIIIIMIMIIIISHSVSNYCSPPGLMYVYYACTGYQATKAARTSTAVVQGFGLPPLTEMVADSLPVMPLVEREAPELKDPELTVRGLPTWAPSSNHVIVADVTSPTTLVMEAVTEVPEYTVEGPVREQEAAGVTGTTGLSRTYNERAC